MLAVVEQLIMFGILKRTKAITYTKYGKVLSWFCRRGGKLRISTAGNMYLIIEYTGMFPRYVVAMTIVCKAHVHVSTCTQTKVVNCIFTAKLNAHVRLLMQ